MSEVPNLDDLWTYIGQRVIIGRDTYGTLRYCGITHFSDNECCGIELDDNVGNNDGSVHERRYFTCKKNHGVFVLASEINVISDESGTYLEVAAFFPSVIEIFNPMKVSFTHDENFSSKKSSEDADSNESLGILPHLCSLNEGTNWDDSMILTKDNSKGLKSCKSKSDADHNTALDLHDLTASILSLDNSPSMLLHNRDEYHEMLNTTIVLPSKIVELDECQTDLNTTMVLSDKKLEYVNQNHNKLSPFQIFACNEAVVENGPCVDLNSTVIFPDRSVETENKVFVDLNTTVVLDDKCEEFDKTRDISRTETVNVSGSPINVFPVDSPKFASTPKHEINFSFNGTFQLNDLAKAEEKKAVLNEKNFSEYISPIRPNELIRQDDVVDLKNKLDNVNDHITVPALNETFDHAKFNSEERFTQDYEKSAFTCKINIQDQNVDTLKRSVKPVTQCLTLDEPDANFSKLHEKQDTFSLSKNYLNITLDVKKIEKNLKTMPDIEEESDTVELIQEQKGDINILNVTHSVLGELENKLGFLNSQESSSECGKIKTLDATFKKIKETDTKVTNTKALSFRRYPPKHCANRKSISQFGSSNFTNTEPKPPESRSKIYSFSSDKNTLPKNDKTKIIYPTSKISLSIKENNNTALQQKHLIDTHHANVTKIVRGKNERNVVRECSKLLCFKPNNVTKKMPKNLSGHDETRIIIPSIDEMKPKEEITELIDAKKSRIMHPTPQTSDILHPINTTVNLENINIRKPGTFKNTYDTEACTLVPTLKAEVKAPVTENADHLKTSSQSKTETTKKIDRTDAVMKQPGIRKPSMTPAESQEKKDAAIRISTKRLSQQMTTRKSFRYSAGFTRNLDDHDIQTVSSFPSKDISYPPKKSTTHPPVIAESNRTRKSVTYLHKPATTVLKSSPSKESVLHLPRNSSRIPQRDFSRIPRPFSSHPPRIVDENITSNPDCPNAVSCS